MSQWPPSQAELEHTLIAAELRCSRCSYNLRGLSPLGRCPECGSDIWSSVVRTVDPAASRLPKLTNPKAVAWSLLWIMVCSSLAAVMLALPQARDSLNLNWPGVFGWPIEKLAFVACVLIVAALPGVTVLAPPRGKEQTNAVWLRIWLLAIGLTGWAACSYWLSIIATSPHGYVMLMVLQMAMITTWIIALFGMDGILKTIGQRSRAYRTARGGRQSAQAMIAAACAAMLGVFVQGLARQDVLSPRVEGYGTVLVWVSTFMLLIGLGYMLINTVWIWHALRKPPPRLSAILLKLEDRGRVRSTETRL